VSANVVSENPHPGKGPVGRGELAVPERATRAKRMA
jgi:hypothetical protein